MTAVAKFRLSQQEAIALADAFDGNELLAALPISLGEGSNGQWQVLVYLSETNEHAEAVALQRTSDALFGDPAPSCEVEKLPNTDWVAKSLEGLVPVRVGRFLVHGSHDREARRPPDIAIEIDAGQAFGTGHHGTTAGCLAEIGRVARARPIANALDVGTGSGVLAIAIAKAAKAPVLASDIDPVAIQVARGNFRLNGVTGLVTTAVAPNLASRAFRLRAPYDLIVANILAGPLVALAPAISRLLAPSGSIILSGLLPNQRARVLAAYRGLGLALRRTHLVDGWLTMVFGRPSSR